MNTGIQIIIKTGVFDNTIWFKYQLPSKILFEQNLKKYTLVVYYRNVLPQNILSYVLKSTYHDSFCVNVCGSSPFFLYTISCT